MKSRIGSVLLSVTTVFGLAYTTSAAVFNLRIVTDASPDYSDMDSMIRSITASWPTPEQKCWAMFYWNHIARRQTAPMVLHGLALTDPIRQFNDYGYTMCSTISGINCSIWDAMGLKAKYWDISNHTVPEVEYDGRWHMYDNSMSAIYTLCDGKTLAGVADIGQPGACDASAGQIEPGHIARYHCLNSTSSRGFLTGADTIRSLDEEYRCFNPNALKYRPYFYDWDRGHRYILNLRDGEAYTRYYHRLGDSPAYYVPNHGKDPEAVNQRYRIRGNGLRILKPNLILAELDKIAHSHSRVTASADRGVTPVQAGVEGEIVFKIDGANVITALRMRGAAFRRHDADAVRISVSTVNGLAWNDVWQSTRMGEQPIDLQLIDPVNGAYEVLVKISLIGAKQAADAQLRQIEFETVTMLNSKTQPKLALGKNIVVVRAGEPTESIVFWPDLRGDHFRSLAVDERNIATSDKHPGYMGTMYAARPNQSACVVFKIDAPRDISRIHYGGRFYNRAPRSHIDLLHSFDAGHTWTRSYSLTNTAQPWDVIHFQSVDSIPPATRSVLFKYLLESSAAGPNACSLYAVRMEVNHQAVDPAFHPLEATFHWSEPQPDYSLKQRSHTERIESLPHRYFINTGGADHPIVHSLRIGAANAAVKTLGDSDHQDVGGERFVARWVTYGKNLARNKRYTVSVPSNTQWGAGDPEGTKLTDGIAGPPYPGGAAPRFALCWNKGERPAITVDLGEPQTCGAFRIQLGAGWPWWDALKGEFTDQAEVLTSLDGKHFESHSFFNLNLRWKDLPVNHLWPDEEAICAHLFELIPPAPVTARYVRFQLTPQRALIASEVEVLESIRYEPFDLRLTLPD